MSVPPSLARPAHVADRVLPTERGDFAALGADPVACGWSGTAHAPVVLVPGFTGSKEDFLAVLHPLAAAGFPVLAFDQRGQYETGGAPPPEGWTLEAFAADLLAVAAVHGGGAPVHLLGHSFGGLVARAAVLADPARFCSLTLLSSGPAAFTGDAAGLLIAMADGLERLGLPAVWAAKVRHDLNQGWQPPEDPLVRAFLEARFLANDPAALAAKARLLASEPDRTDQLARVAPPTLVAFGADDDVWSPRIQAEMASRLGATCVSLPEAAHSPAAERPADTADLLSGFWAATETSGSARNGEGRR